MLFQCWARGMAFFGFIALLAAVWMNIILPLFFHFAVFRWFALFCIVSIIAIAFGGIMSNLPPVREADEYPELFGDEVSGD
jgi:hypothetical protein